MVVNGGFAEYCAYSASKLFHFQKCSWEEASLFEATACAVHGLDRVKPPAGSKVLLLGAGPTGLCLAQLLKMNSGSHVVLASNEGPKMQLARSLGAADEYVDLSRSDPTPQWEELKKSYTHGFDIVVEATGSIQILERAIEYCTRGGKLLVYGVYPPGDVKISPMRLMMDEITLVG